MLRACALKHGGSWDKSLPYTEFSYNNSYQASLKMSPFAALYGRKCMTPLCRDQTGERQFFGPEIIQEAEEQVWLIRENLRTSQSRQKSYADPSTTSYCYYLRVSAFGSEFKHRNQGLRNLGHGGAVPWLSISAVADGRGEEGLWPLDREWAVTIRS
jgi:hypothetical protein